MNQPTDPVAVFNPSRTFILRPVATSLLMIGLLLCGVLAYRLLPVSALPQVDYPTVQVLTFYPGASPEVMTSMVTAPLERQFGQIPGLARMASTSSAGTSMITLQFSLELDIDDAVQHVQAAINAASGLLPADLPQMPVYSKVNPADTPIMTLAVTSSALPLHKVQDLVDTRLAQKIAQLPGVGMVSLSGGQRPAVRVQVNHRALASYGISLADVRNVIAAANVNQPKGMINGAARSAIIDANDQLRSAADYRQLVVAYRNQAPVQLSDVAEIIDGVENTGLAAWSDDTPAIIVNIQRQPGSNVIEVVDRIQALLPSLQASLPPEVTVTSLTDRTVTIRASVRDVQFELLLAVALVVLVIFLFLRNLPATLIAAVAVPLSLVGTFTAMYLAEFSLNNLTLMALTIATGFVVDDAIVVIENIARYREQGNSPLQAALKGSAQIGFTIISLTISLVAVLIPLLFMGELTGRLFREFAITLAVAILISAVISLTLTPMLCAKLLHDRHPHGDSVKTGGFERLVRLYARSLAWVMQRQTLTLWLFLATVAATAALYAWIPKSYFPPQDTGLIQGYSEAPQNISFQALAERQQQIAGVILQDPDVASLSSFVGVDGVNTSTNVGRFLINLKPHAERKASAADVIGRIKRHLSEQHDMSLYLQAVQDLTMESQVSRSQFQMSLEAGDRSQLNRWTDELVRRLCDNRLFDDVASDIQANGRQIFVDVDRVAAGRLGVSMLAIDDALYSAFGQRMVSTIFTQSNQYRVILEAKPDAAAGAVDSLQALNVPSASGGQVPLSAVARLSERDTPLLVSRIDQLPSATLSFNVAEGRALGDAVSAISDTLRAMDFPLSIRTHFQGAAQIFTASQLHTLWLILAAIVCVYLVLGVLYESYIHPLTILSTLPSAGVGALLALLLNGDSLSIIGFIGIILLIGIVKKNAIMMIDFALEAERSQGLSPEQAIFQACLLRLRPILMTTLAALLGALPLMLGSGVGSELRQPLGISMVGGLLLSQLLTLYTTPVIYLRMDALAKRFARGGTDAWPVPQAGAENEP